MARYCRFNEQNKDCTRKERNGKTSVFFNFEMVRLFKFCLLEENHSYGFIDARNTRENFLSGIFLKRFFLLARINLKLLHIFWFLWPKLNELRTIESTYLNANFYYWNEQNRYIPIVRTGCPRRIQINRVRLYCRMQLRDYSIKYKSRYVTNSLMNVEVVFKWLGNNFLTNSDLLNKPWTLRV